MADVHFAFKTKAFADSAEIRARNVNGVMGHGLARWLSARLNDCGLAASEVWAEDHGWDFSVEHQGGKYLCACSIADDDPSSLDGHVVLHKSRSLKDRLMGRNILVGDDPVAAAIASALAACNDVAGLETEWSA